MKHSILIIMLFFIGLTNLAYSQNKEAQALEIAMEAIKLMDKGDFDQSIELLKKSENLDPENINYPYEMALAYTHQKKYKEAIQTLEKLTEHSQITDQIYQLLGNVYSMSGDPEIALKIYEEGLSKFPNAGNLFLEKGNIFLQAKEYNTAVENYEKGIAIAPNYSSNYYRLALLFLNSTNKVPGLIYGEIFMNLERTTPRTQEISKLLLHTYKESISITPDSTNLDFCEIVIKVEDLEVDEFKLPFCAIYGKHMVFSTIGIKKIGLKELTLIRSKFIELFFEEDSKKYPNILFDYHKKMIDEKVFLAYNYYLFQMGETEEFENWLKENRADYDSFVDWYTNEKNYLNLSSENLYLSTQY